MTNIQATNDQTSLQRLIAISLALSAEQEPSKLMEAILLEAKALAHADGGTLYTRTQESSLAFELVRNDSLGLAQGGSASEAIRLPPVPMYQTDGSPNLKNLVSNAALKGKPLNIADAYDTQAFDLAGTRQFDRRTGYRTQSVLTVPLMDSQGEVTGVLQLLNAQDEAGQVISFSPEVQSLIEALASLAAVTLEKALLIAAQEKLLDSFVSLMARMIDAKSPYTGSHCERVPALTEMLAQAACQAKAGPFATFDLTSEQWRELHLSAWLHDCGKVTTPEYVVDKATKLETINNRIHEIRMRFEVLKRDKTIACLEQRLAGKGDPARLQAELEASHASLDEDFRFIAECNLGGEAMTEAQRRRVKQIAAMTWVRTLDDRAGISQAELKRKAKQAPKPLPAVEPLLADRDDHLIEHDVPVHAAAPDNAYGFKVEVPEYKCNLGEIHNLCIARGTLTEEDRFRINDHIVQTIVMLESLPWPRHLKRVPEIAGGHHERMDGKGYPKRLKGSDMSPLARMMAIADVFEALTAGDRPYKPAKSLGESLGIMSQMVQAGHLDTELFRLFLEAGVYRDYAAKYLQPGQLDQVDISALLPP